MRNFMIVAMCFSVGMLLAQEEAEYPLWILLQHDIAAEETYEDMNRIIRRGYVPAGIEVQGDEVSVLYYLSPQDAPSKWIFYEFSDLSMLNGEFSAFLKEGWQPVDISSANDSLYALFVPATTSFASWRIATVDSLPKLEEQYAVYRGSGYELMGLSKQILGSYWALFVKPKVPSGEFSDLLTLFTDEEFEDGFTEKMTAGLIPRSLLVDRKNRYFVRFRTPAVSVE